MQANGTMKIILSQTFIKLVIDDFPPFKGKEVPGRILRVSRNNHKYTVGCQTYNEHPEVYEE